MKRCCAILGTLLALAVGAAGVAGWVLLRDGASARAEPLGAETALARWARGLAIPAPARARANPVPATAQAVAEGRAHFADHCASCHANDGSGDTAVGRGLYPRAPDMRLPATQRLSDGELFWIIENGVRLTGMPAWGAPGEREESWKLVHFLRHLPSLSEEEKREMEWLNPRSPREWRELEEDEAFLRGAGPPAAPDEGHRHGGRRGEGNGRGEVRR